MNQLTSALLINLIALSSSAYANAVDENSILRNEQGSLKVMSQRNAFTACPTGTHLPSIRELAVLSESQGAKGLLELNQIVGGAVPAGYALISAAGNTLDRFYFNPEGYHPIAGDLGNYWFWSSSIFSQDEDSAYIFNGKNGAVGTLEFRDYSYGAVLCFPGAKDSL